MNKTAEHLTTPTTGIKYQFLIALIVLLLCGFSQLAYANSLIVISKSSPSYTAVAQTIKTTQQHVTIIALDKLSASNIQPETFDTVVAVGSKATDHLLATLQQCKNLYVSFIPKRHYESLLSKHAKQPCVSQQRVSAVYLDQPSLRKMRLARLIQPKAITIATAVGDNSTADLKQLTNAAQHQSLVLKHQTLAASDNPIRKLQPLIENSDIFLSLPDRSVFNRTTAKWILYISFRQKIPVIGFSKKYVDAGALAAVYSTPEQIGRHTAELITATQTSSALSKGSHCKYFSVAINKNAAATIGIDIPSAEKLEAQLQELEQ